MKKVYPLYQSLLLILLCVSPLVFSQNTSQLDPGSKAGESISESGEETSEGGKDSLVTLDVEIDGVHGKTEQNVEQRLQVEYPNLDQPLSATTAQQRYQAIPDVIQQALTPYGYFNATIQSTLEKSEHAWQAQYIIHLGPRTTFTSPQLTLTGPGADNPALVALREHLLKPGTSFTTERYQAIKAKLFNTAHNQGYIKAKLTTDSIEIDRTNHQAHLILVLDTGPYYVFGAVSFLNTTYQTRFLNKYLPFSPGQPYATDQLATLQQRLLKSGYFREVEVTPKINQAKANAVPIVITTKAVPKQVYNLGAGYGTNTGFRTNASVQFNHLTNDGQHATVALNLSIVNSVFSANYFIPGADPLKNQYVLGASMQAFEPSGGNAYAKQLSASYASKLTHGMQVSSNVHYLHERYEVEDSDYLTEDLVYPSITFSQLTTNHLINPDKGHFIALEGRGSDILSPTAFLQETLSGKWIYALSKNNLIQLRGNLGATQVDDLDKLPLTLRYFAGGVNSVRGYEPQDIGPGKYLKVMSVEWQYRLYQNFYTALYNDEGTANDNFSEALDKGAGVGLVWHSPIGQVGFYVTKAYTKDDKPIRIDFSIGTSL